MREIHAIWVRRITEGLLVISALALAAVGVHRYRVLKPQLLQLLPQGLGGGEIPPNDAPVGVYTGFEHTESVSGSPVFQILASQTLGLESGWYRLEGVTLKLYRKRGGWAEVRCDRARFNARSRAAELEGSVHLQLKDGIFVDTRWGRFDPRTRTFSSSGEVFFGRGATLGRAGVLDYHLDEDQLVLREGVRVFGPSGSLLVSPRLIYDRQRQEVRFPEGCRITNQSSSAAAPDVRIVLASRDGEPAELFLTGGATFSSSGHEGLGRIRGRTERLHMKREGGGTWRGVARTTGSWIELELTQGPDFLYRRLRTWRLEFVVGPQGPVSARSTGVTCLLDIPPDGPERSAQSESGTYRFESGTLNDMELRGSVELRAGSTRAWAETARFLARERLVSLQTEGEGSGRRVRAATEGSRLWADEIQLLEGGERLTARGDVQGETQRMALGGGPDGGGGITRFAAQSLEAWPRRSRMVLRRNARVWQGSRLLLADEIRVDETSRTMDATGDVRMTLPAEEGGTASEGELLVVARTLHYAQADGVAVFEGGVRLSDPRHILSSAKLTVTLGEGGAVEGFLAEGQVTVEETAVHRRMTGERARFERVKQTLVVTGAPAHLVDEKGNVVSGRSLTWHRADDTVTVAGEETSPTETIYHPEG